MIILIEISVAILTGLLMTRIINLIKLPDVTAYLIAGILIGPYFIGKLGISGLGFATLEEVGKLDVLSSLALGFIAFTIGTEFMLPKLKKIGKQATAIGVFQAVLASILVSAALIGTHFLMPDKIGLPAAITLGAVASATAPAATLMVVQQYKAKGVVTDMLLPVVALDDAVGLICFAIASGIAKALQGGSVELLKIIVNPLIEIFASIVLGGVLGFALTQLVNKFKSHRNRKGLIIATVTLTVALSMIKVNIGDTSFEFSSLLVCMMLGTMFCNLCDDAEDLMQRIDNWTAPLFCLFFVLSGASLEISSFGDLQMILIGMVFIVIRCIGKYFGARWSAIATHCDERIVKYLGITLFPQAGVALGMSLSAVALLGAEGNVVRNITLFAVMVYELFGPLLTKIALTKSGDIKTKSEASRSKLF